jgi:RNA polymerase sigma-70 factor (ECF subfamily)
MIGLARGTRRARLERRVESAAGGGQRGDAVEEGLQSLVRRLAQGHCGALEPLYERLDGAAFQLCLKMLRSRYLAEEAVQETFLEVWRRAGEYDPARGGVKAWALMIARTKAIDLYRRQALVARTKSDWRAVSHVWAGSAPFPDALVVQKRQRAQLWVALQALPAVERSVVELSFIHGLSHTEIAHRTGNRLGTVKTRVRRGLKHLGHLYANQTQVEQ